MHHTPSNILDVLDDACRSFHFPMLDNGYVYLAATRLSLFRSELDWALVIELFGYSPRAGHPDTQILTFASRLHDRDSVDQYVSEDAYRAYLANHPHDESRFVEPLEEGDWIDPEDQELLAEHGEVRLRGKPLPLPSAKDYAECGIEVTGSRPAVFELCRYLAAKFRDDVLASPSERRVSILPEMTQMLQLEEWRHPDTVSDELPSHSECFQQLAQVVATGDTSHYRPSEKPNTHWRNWPDGGQL